MKRLVLFLLACCVALPSCSVFKAAKKEGVALEEVTTCKTRTCLVAKGAEPVSCELNELKNFCMLILKRDKIRDPPGDHVNIQILRRVIFPTILQK